ncbi:hypothetical protein HBI56_143360 [Parastagonospora nodorum]|uniref:Uncharacterized protein n=1 Tax=Phaeosphaeria nodorum (strain SN15 / ATCC MYA-4574 / FGSC 10173) TaxID=321614 RepID=A0A7U2I554_PHANO|nr:hypothetical protein HBH56_033690 [Parastagonospora nodorum]QRD00217.1 hypothetical protein JI435_414800 [Parastagonospora nodorum SN15]KAH3933662.1 hypothetical protein HBH54_065740 [Parastagonospora nodorum]KAH3952453.1 hypothetical protein HBH53_044290 [Parastagonospora nodorum]KAH3979662.1 hypothetical protein HBH51_055330 [Parastagonospora nodorum]
MPMSSKLHTRKVEKNPKMKEKRRKKKGKKYQDLTLHPTMHLGKRLRTHPIAHCKLSKIPSKKRLLCTISLLVQESASASVSKISICQFL